MRLNVIKNTMMKKKILVLAFALGVFNTTLHAQLLRLENVSPAMLSELNISPDEQTFCSVYPGKSETGETNLTVTFYNHLITEMHKGTIEVAPGTVLLTSGFTGEVAAIFLADPGKKTRTIITIDRHGNTIQRKEEENVSPVLLKPESYLGVYAVTPTEFVIMQSTGAKTGDVEMERFTMALDPGRKIVVKPENGKMNVEQTVIKYDNVYMLCKVTTGINNDKTQYFVKATNLASGENIYSTLFGQGNECGLPATMQVNEDMSVELSGLLFHEGDIDKTPDGFAWIRIDEKGNPMYMHKEWNEILERSQNNIIKEISAGKLDVLIEDRFAMAESENYVLIGEVFEKNNGGAGTANFAVKDFIMFKFSKDGELLSAEKIEKTPKLATVRGTGATGGRYLLAKRLYDDGFFTYRMHKQKAERINLLSRYYNGKTDIATVLSISDSLIDKKGAAFVALNEETEAEVAKSNSSKKNPEKNIPVITMEINLDDKNAADRLNKLTIMKENRALVQGYKDSIFTARIINIPLE